ncbi:MAG: hypothetical protein R6U32_05610 [Candidatus Woesearchaeota archaeon]
MDEKIKGFIIKKMFQHGYWGKKHTSFDNIQKGLPSHSKGNAKSVARKLIKENILLAKPTSYGLEVSLNPKKKEEIMRYV